MRRSWSLRLMASQLLLSACGGAAPAPGAPPDIDGGLIETDSGPEEPVDCRSSVGTQDVDRDGFSRARGDCDDCDGMKSPAAIDVPSNGVDEDCDEEDATSAPLPCDDDLDPEAVDPEQASRALGVCEQHSQVSRLSGLLEAHWMRLSGSSDQLLDARQVWLPEKFGTIAPREGGRLLVLSTGVARDVNDQGYTDDCDTFNTTRGLNGVWSDPVRPPDDYPRDSSQCPKGTSSADAGAYNDVILELTLRVPSNAKSLGFDSMFFTYEYPDFVCSQFNDFFVVFVDPAPAGLEESKDWGANVLFDASGDTIGVNTGLLAVCREAERGRVARPVACEQGPALLKDTGFDAGESRCASKQTTKRDIGGASTGWLHTDVPVPAGKVITLRFVLWDSGDPLLDSTVLLDNLQWSLTEREVSTGPITGG